MLTRQERGTDKPITRQIRESVRKMTAKTFRARHRRFISAGFFPPELPPCFYSETFAKHRNFLVAEFGKLPLKKNSPDYHSYISQKASFGFPRFRNSDRRHSIVNPIAFFFLSSVLSKNYVKLKAIGNKSKISASPPIFDWSGERTLKRPNFESRDKFISDMNAQFEFVVSTDIAAFYHSIYTHAIAWAIHGKAIAKKNRSNSLIGNLIDKLCRNLQDGQTIGLPVGPDTSRMIAELVGSAIDVEISKSVSKIKGRGIRFVDDFTMGCGDRREAETAIATIRRATNAFELDLNSEKTSITSSVAALPGGWKSLVKSIVPKKPYSKEDMEIFSFKISELATQLPNINVAKFAIQNSRRAFVECEDWKGAENYLVSLYKTNTTLVDTMVEIFVLRHNRSGDISKEMATSFIQSRLPLLCEHRRHGEAAWLLFMAISIGLKIKNQSVEGFFADSNALTALLIADLKAKGLIVGKIDPSVWNKSLTTDDLDGEMWLYSYESTLKGINGSGVGDGFLKSHRYFGKLYEKKIDFYRSGLGIGKISEMLQKRKRENATSHRLALDFDEDHTFNIDELEDFDDFDDLDDTY